MGRFKDIVWTAVVSVAFTTIAVASAVFGGSLQTVVSFALAGVSFAMLTPK